MTSEQSSRAAGEQSGDGSGGHVVRRIERGVAWIVLNRPDAGNAMTAERRAPGLIPRLSNYRPVPAISPTMKPRLVTWARKTAPSPILGTSRARSAE